MNKIKNSPFLPITILLLSVAGAANASTFVGELDLGAASTLKPADRHTLFLKQIRVVVNTDAIETAVLALSNSELNVNEGTDDVCNPRDTDVSRSANTSNTAIDLTFYEGDLDHDVILSNQQASISFSAGQNFSQDFELPVSRNFDPARVASLIGSTSLNQRLEVGAQLATTHAEQDIAIEITSVQVGATGSVNSNSVEKNKVHAVIVNYRAYPIDQNPSNPMELVEGSATLHLAK